MTAVYTVEVVQGTGEGGGKGPCVIGYTVVVRDITSVVLLPIGQFVIVYGHDVIVYVTVVKIVDVVSWPGCPANVGVISAPGESRGLWVSWEAGSGSEVGLDFEDRMSTVGGATSTG